MISKAGVGTTAILLKYQAAVYKGQYSHMNLLRAFIFPLLLASCHSESQNATTESISVPPENTSTFDTQGHRGARGLKPENTLPSFEAALDLGVSTLELDLHYSADNKVVVWHDDRIKKNKCKLIDPSSNAPDPESTVDLSSLLIRNLSVQKLKAYRCDLNPDTALFPHQNKRSTELALDNYTIPTLAELFQFVNAYAVSQRKTKFQQSNAVTVKFNLETKRRPTRPEVINDDFDGVNPGQFELEILRLIDLFNLDGRASIQSFDFRSLWAIAAVRPSIPLVALSDLDKPDINELSARGATTWSPNIITLETADIDRAHSLGIKVIPWTVNEPALIGKAIEMGVDGVISDYPDRVLSQLKD